MLAAGGVIGTIAIRKRLAVGAEDNITLEALLLEAPAPATEAISIPADGEQLETFAGPHFNPSRDDVSVALERASDWSARSGRPVIVQGTWQLHNPAVLSHAGATLIFVNAELRVRDDGRWITTQRKKTVPFGLFVTADRVSLLGHCILTGLGKPGKTWLQGIYFEQVMAPKLGRFTIRNMAVGEHFMCCDEVSCGFLDAYSMWGLQGSQDKPNGAGSAQVVSGCRRSRFAGFRSLRNDKSARYLSVGGTNDGSRRDNQDNEYGPAEVAGRPGSLWCHVTGVRSSVDSRFVGGVGVNVSFLVVIEKNDTDDAYHIDGNDFGDWSGTIVDAAGSSVDAALHIYAVPGNLTPVGKNRFGRVRASMSPTVPNIIQRMGYRLPATFGIYANSGDTQIAAAHFDGFTHHIHVEQSALTISSFISQNMARQPILYGAGANLRVGSYIALTDIVGPGEDEALVGPTRRNLVPTPKVEFERIDVRRAMPALRTDYILDDPGSGGHVRIGRVMGQMREGRVRVSGAKTGN